MEEANHSCQHAPAISPDQRSAAGTEQAGAQAVQIRYTQEFTTAGNAGRPISKSHDNLSAARLTRHHEYRPMPELCRLQRRRRGRSTTTRAASPCNAVVTRATLGCCASRSPMACFKMPPP